MKTGGILETSGFNLGNSGNINLASKGYMKGYNSAKKKYLKLLEEVTALYMKEIEDGYKKGYIAGGLEQVIQTGKLLNEKTTTIPMKLCKVCNKETIEPDYCSYDCQVKNMEGK